MNLTTKKKNELLDYAIERINQYDDFLDKSLASVAIYLMPDCKGCELAGRIPLKLAADCSICPFSINNHKYTACRPFRQLNKTPKKHQDDLIKAVNKWCKKFYPKYKVVRV